ncbi:MAG: VWA domain-containing protein [Polyangiaceae bacterium]
MKLLELTTPQGLWLLAALVPLIGLYILKVRRTRVRVASTWLWASARRDVLARSPFQKLTVQVPLILQILALALLAFALAGPATRHRAILGDHIAIVIDTSASMSAVDPQSHQARIELAKRAATDALSALSPGSDAMVLASGREPKLVSAPDRDPQRLAEAIAKLQAEDVEGDLGAAIAFAVDRLKQQGASRRVVVFTDGALAHPDSLSMRGMSTPLEVFTVGEPIENAGIIRVDVRSGLDATTKREEVQAFAVVGNFGTKQRDVFITLRLANIDQPLASRRLLLQPGERAPVVLTFAPAPGDYNKGLLFEISPHDAMPVDDVAYARVPAGQKQPAVLVTNSKSPWWERALTSDPLVDLFKGTPDEVAKASIADGALYIYDGVCPPIAPLGDYLITAPPAGSCLGIKVGDTVDKPAITSWSNGDPRMRFLTLDGVHVIKSSSLTVETASQALIRSQHEVLASDASVPGRTGTILGFDVGDSDWPLKASFVLFSRNLLEIARNHRAQGSTGAARTGMPLRVSVPAGAAPVKVEIPGAKDAREIPAREGMAVLSETARAGFYLVSWQGPRPGSALLPVNLTSESESDLRKKPTSVTVEEGQAPVSKAAQLADAHTDWSYVVALVALLFVIFDVWWLTRKPAARANVAVAAPPIPERRAS